MTQTPGTKPEAQEPLDVDAKIVEEQAAAHHPGTVAGRMPAGLSETTHEESGSPGADTDRTQAEKG